MKKAIALFIMLLLSTAAYGMEYRSGVPQTGGSGGGSAIIKSNNSEVDDAVTTLDFSTLFTLTESPDHEINITLAGLLEQLNDLTIAKGTLIVGSASDTLGATAVGTEGQILQVGAAGALEWVSTLNFSFYGAIPEALWRDSDGAGSAATDKNAGHAYANFSTVTEDSEVSDFWVEVYGTPGNTGDADPSTDQIYAIFQYDGSDYKMYFGPLLRGTTMGTAIADYENIYFDFDPATDNEIGVGTTSSADTLNFNAFHLITTGEIKGRVDVVSDADGRTITKAEAMGVVHLATGAGTWELPDIDAADGTGWAVVVYSTTAAAVVVDPNAEDKIRYDGTLETAGDKITSASAAGDFVALVVTELSGDIATWTVLGKSGTWTPE